MYDKSMCCNCVLAAVNMQPNHFWPTLRCKIVSLSPLSVARYGGGCASFVNTTVFSAFNSEPTCSKCIINESINWPNPWRERAKIKMSSAKRKSSKFGPPSIRSMPACPTACFHFRMANSKTAQNNRGLRTQPCRTPPVIGNLSLRPKSPTISPCCP